MSAYLKLLICLFRGHRWGSWTDRVSKYLLGEETVNFKKCSFCGIEKLAGQPPGFP
jgi:hypothetical protein